MGSGKFSGGEHAAVSTFSAMRGCYVAFLILLWEDMLIIVVNYEALLIAFGVIGGILLISLVIFICCCYRRCSQRCRARR